MVNYVELIFMANTQDVHILIVYYNLYLHIMHLGINNRLRREYGMYNSIAFQTIAKITTKLDQAYI